MLYFNGRSILLIRNPFKAIISFFVHVVFGTHSDTEFGKWAVENKLFRKVLYLLCHTRSRFEPIRVGN